MNTIHFIGYSAIHPSDFHFEMTTAPRQYTLLLVATPVQFLLGEQWQEYPPGTAMLYAPGQAVCYRACGAAYQNDWMLFSTDDPLVTQFPLTGSPFPVSDTAYCHNLFKLLTWEVSLASADSDLAISNLLQVLFLRLRQDTSLWEASPHASLLLQLHKEIYNSPQQPWNIRSMAQRLHLSAGYLQFLYKKMFGVSCMEDVIASRIRLAEEQLTYTEKPVAEIADICGYRNIEHFYRQFRQHTGLTPGAFRRMAPETHAALTIPQKEALADMPAEAAPYTGNPIPAPFISQSHYNVAGSDLPSGVLDSEGNIIPPSISEN